jgi:hypothetical protein
MWTRPRLPSWLVLSVSHAVIVFVFLITLIAHSSPVPAAGLFFC